MTHWHPKNNLCFTFFENNNNIWVFPFIKSNKYGVDATCALLRLRYEPAPDGELSGQRRLEWLFYL